jgi:membrane fusion protein, multidrug efflux system
MDNDSTAPVRAVATKPPPRVQRRSRILIYLAILAVIGVGGSAYLALGGFDVPPAMAAAPTAPPTVTVNLPLARTVADRRGFLGQFSAVDDVEIRAQVGGVLTEIHFQDGQIVHRGDLLFVIDPRPYDLKLQMAMANLKSAQSRWTLAREQVWRAEQLKQRDFGSAENVDLRAAEVSASQAALEAAASAVQDANLDLEYCHVTAPFTGRISAHRVSVGSLVSGSRAGSSATTLLTTLVSLDPIHLDFQMSENDFLDYATGHPGGGLGEDIDLRLGNEQTDTRHGVLDFIDNAIDRNTGTIHARATVPNSDMFLVPGTFARLDVMIGKPATALLLPDAAVLLDQSQHVVMTVGADGSVIPKIVQIGGLSDGLRIVRQGLEPSDKVIVDGLMLARPGAKVTPDVQPLTVPPNSGA